jgi:hypothetical protein
MSGKRICRQAVDGNPIWGRAVCPRRQCWIVAAAEKIPLRNDQAMLRNNQAMMSGVI